MYILVAANTKMQEFLNGHVSYKSTNLNVA